MKNLSVYFGESLVAKLPKYIKSFVYANGELTINVDFCHISKVLFFIKNHSTTQYKVLIDMTAVDYPSKDFRFEVVYSLLSVRFNSRLRIKTVINELETINSATSLYPSANWAEREIWDMFGIFFSGHSDLRRILTDYGFEGHPLRKDFPLSGYIAVRYDELTKIVVCEPIEHAQEFRSFNLETPWNSKN